MRVGIVLSSLESALIVRLQSHTHALFSSGQYAIAPNSEKASIEASMEGNEETKIDFVFASLD